MDANTGMRAIVPVAITTLDVALPRRISVAVIVDDDATFAPAAVATSALVANQANLLHELRTGRCAGRIEIGGVCALHKQTAGACQNGDGKVLHKVLLLGSAETALSGK